MPDPGSARVLVVDDRPEMAELIVDALAEHGYASLSATSGRVALQLLATERIDALVTDLSMPEVDGLDLLGASLAQDPSRPVILMTAYGALDTALQATQRGAYHYLTKPFRLETLVRVLVEALKGRRGGPS